MAVLFPFIITTYSSHVILSEGVGKVTLVHNITSYFISLAALGIPNYGTKKIGSIQHDKAERNKVFTELFIINTTSTLICIVLFFAMIFIFPYFRGNTLYFVFSSLLLLNFANVDWLYEGMEEYKFIAIRSIVVRLLCLIALPIFVRKESDILPYAVILCAATVGNYILNLINLPRFVSFTNKGINITRHLKYIFMLLASVIATEIYTMLDSTMVGTICSEQALGYYANASKTARMAYIFVTAACAVFLPRLSLYWKEKRNEDFSSLVTKGMKYVLVIAIPIFAGIEILADRLIPVLFGEDFNPSITTLRILAILVIVFSVAYIGGHIVLIASNNEKFTMIAAFIGAGTNFVMNLILINTVGYNGAAIASVIAEILVTVFLLYSARHIVKYSFNVRFFVTTVLSCIIMSFLVIVLKKVITHKLISIIVCGTVGAGVYFGFQLLFKNDIVIMIKDKVLSKLGGRKK